MRHPRLAEGSVQGAGALLPGALQCFIHHQQRDIFFPWILHLQPQRGFSIQLLSQPGPSIPRPRCPWCPW